MVKISPPARRRRRCSPTLILLVVSLAGLVYQILILTGTPLELNLDTKVFFPEQQQVEVEEPSNRSEQQQVQVEEPSNRSLVERRIPPNAKTSEEEELCKVTQHLESEVQNPKNQAEVLKAPHGSLYSRFYQDATLISALGKLFHSDDFLYVDLADSWPEKESNTALLDRCYGWKGLCIGIDQTKLQSLKQERSCQVLDPCLTDVEKESTQCKTLATIFDKYRIKKVDVLSLDEQGAKVTVMGGIDFNKVTIDIIVFKLQHLLADTEGQLQEDAQRIIQMLNQEGYVPVLQLFSYRNGLPIQDCDTVLFGKSVESVFKPPDALQRWRTQDVLFVQSRSHYLSPLMDWTRSICRSKT